MECIVPIRTFLSPLVPLLALIALVPAPAAAQAAGTTPPQQVAAAPELRQRIDALPSMLRGEGEYAAYFHPGFIAQVPKAMFDQVTAQLAANAGPVQGIASVTPIDAWSATITVAFERGTATMRIAVDPRPPHQVTELLVTGLAARESSIDGVVAALAALPGGTGFALAKLGDGAPRILVARNVDTPLAIGSAFKLVILAELVRAINAGERHWDDVVALDGRALPGGLYMGKPAGTQVTLRELAAKMISISDNSATDILLSTLGREKIEAMLPVVGIADPARMRPFLSTLELFKLKGARGGALADRWLAQDEAGRRAMLAGEIAATPITAIDPMLFRDGKPVRIDTLEWFASAADMARVMDWLRRHSESGPGAEARAILSINPALPAPVAGKWAFVGYKGGSEPGVIHMTYLLQGKDGGWYVLSGGWNNPAAGVDEVRFASLMSRAAELAAGQ